MGRRRARPGRADALHRLPSRLEDDGPPADAAQTLSRAVRRLRNGVHYAYTGNVHDAAGGSTIALAVAAA